MIHEKPSTLDRLNERMLELTTDYTFSGEADADEALLTFYSFVDRKLCTAIVDLEEGTVEWPCS